MYKYLKRTYLAIVLAWVVRNMDNAIHWINHYPVDWWFVSLTLIHWVAIYPVDSVIQPSNNWVLLIKPFCMGTFSLPLSSWFANVPGLIESLSKPRRKRQRERHQIKDLINTTIALHVRYKS